MSSDDAPAGAGAAAASGTASGSVTGPNKEMYTYKASWQTHSFGLSHRFRAPKHEFRLALGSFIEDYANRVHVRGGRSASARCFRGCCCFMKYLCVCVSCFCCRWRV